MAKLEDTIYNYRKCGCKFISSKLLITKGKTCKKIHLETLLLCVITSADPEDPGNQYDFIDLDDAIKTVKVPVFTQGEIFAIDRVHGRELHGNRRKPDKWRVAYQEFEFKDIGKAVKLAIEVSK